MSLCPITPCFTYRFIKDKQLPLRDEIRHLWYQEMRYLKKLAPDNFPHDENDAKWSPTAAIY